MTDNGWAVSVTDLGGDSSEAQGGLAVREFGISFDAMSVVNAASIAKQFTALLVLHASEIGKLALSDLVRRWVPGIDPSGEVTVGHCIHHTSGLRDAETLMSLAGVREYDYYTRADVIALLRRQRELIFRPGTGFSYTNSGYFVLAAILEQVFETEFAHLASEKIFRPSGLGSTRVWQGPGAVVENRAYSYRHRGGRVVRADRPFLVVGSSGLMTNARDLGSWLVERDDAIRRLGLARSNLTRSPERVPGFNDRLRYAAGVFVERLFGEPTAWIHHAGHEQGYSSQAMESSRGERIVCVSNQAERDAAAAALAAAFVLLRGGGADRACEAARDWLERGALVTSSVDDAQAAPTPELADLVGTYVSEGLPRPIALEVVDGVPVLRRGGAVDVLSATSDDDVLAGPGYHVRLAPVEAGSRHRGIVIALPRAGTLHFRRTREGGRSDESVCD